MSEFQPNSEVDSLKELVRRTVASVPPAELRWNGTFEDYLGLVQRDPRHARNAWQRLSDMIESHGSRRGEAGTQRWRIFDDPFSARRMGLDDSEDDVTT